VRDGGVLPVPVRLLLDEFSNVGRITDYPKKISTCRGRGISPEMILQDVSQLRSLYGEDDARTILANCDTLLYLGTNELETAAYISRRLGQTTIQVSTSTIGGHPGGTETQVFQGRALLTPDEVLRLSPGDSLLLQRGRYPARLRKPDYTELPHEVHELAHQDYPAPPRAPLRIVDCQRFMPPSRQALGEVPERSARPHLRATRAPRPTMHGSVVVEEEED
jgi:type IV secretory pathway TraG/TraD family ATPase VirD4